MDFDDQISAVCKKCFMHLHYIRQIRPYITRAASQSIIHSLVQGMKQPVTSSATDFMKTTKTTTRRPAPPPHIECDEPYQRLCNDGLCHPRRDLCPEEELVNKNTVLIMIVVGVAVTVFVVILYCVQQRRRSQSSAAVQTTDSDHDSYNLPPPTYREVMTTNLYPPTPHLSLNSISTTNNNESGPLTPPPTYVTALKILSRSQEYLARIRRYNMIPIERRSVSVDRILSKSFQDWSPPPPVTPLDNDNVFFGSAPMPISPLVESLNNHKSIYSINEENENRVTESVDVHREHIELSVIGDDCDALNQNSPQLNINQNSTADQVDHENVISESDSVTIISEVDANRERCQSTQRNTSASSANNFASSVDIVPSERRSPTDNTSQMPEIETDVDDSNLDDSNNTSQTPLINESSFDDSHETSQTPLIAANVNDSKFDESKNESQTPLIAAELNDSNLDDTNTHTSQTALIASNIKDSSQTDSNVDDSIAPPLSVSQSQNLLHVSTDKPPTIISMPDISSVPNVSISDLTSKPNTTDAKQTTAVSAPLVSSHTDGKKSPVFFRSSERDSIA